MARIATDTPLVYNFDTGVVAFRNGENDTQCNCVPIRREHALMLERGEISTQALSAAIKEHLKEKRDFDFDKYIEERRKLNVRKTALRTETPAPELKNRDGELLSDTEIAAAQEAETATPAEGQGEGETPAEAPAEQPPAEELPQTKDDAIVGEAVAKTKGDETKAVSPKVDPAFI